MLDQFIPPDQLPRTVFGIPKFLEIVERALQTAFDAGRYQGRLDVLVPEAALVVFVGAIWGIRRLLK